MNYYYEFYGQKLNPNSFVLFIRKKKNENDVFFFPHKLCVMIILTEDMLSESGLIKDITRLNKLNPADKMVFAELKRIIKDFY